MKEMGRQLLHMIFGALLLFIANFAGRDNTLLLLLIILLLGLLLVQLKLEGFENKFIDFMLENFDRKEKLPARGGITYVAGALFLFAATPFAFALGITAILAFGDGFATMVGLSGKKKLPFPFNPRKTLEGLAAFVLAGVASSMFFVGAETAIFYSVLLAVVESIDLRIDDNLLIPFIATMVKTIFK
ncbi:MAG: hypothetical protein V1717_00780 [Candidatus Micrarchaeota archaeon]